MFCNFKHLCTVSSVFWVFVVLTGEIIKGSEVVFPCNVKTSSPIPCDINPEMVVGKQLTMSFIYQEKIRAVAHPVLDSDVEWHYYASKVVSGILTHTKSLDTNSTKISQPSACQSPNKSSNNTSNNFARSKDTFYGFGVRHGIIFFVSMITCVRVQMFVRSFLYPTLIWSIPSRDFCLTIRMSCSCWTRCCATALSNDRSCREDQGGPRIVNKSFSGPARLARLHGFECSRACPEKPVEIP